MSELFLGVLLVLVAYLLWLADSQSRRLRRLHRKVDAILDHLGVEFDGPMKAQVMDLLKAGEKIKAIKVYREATGASLKEAKDYVEGLQDAAR